MRAPRVLAAMMLGWMALAAAGSQAAILRILNNDLPGEGFNDVTEVAPIGGNPGTTVGQQRLNVFSRAGEIWGALLDSKVEIVVRANFDPLPCGASSGVLGAASPTFVDDDFGGGAIASTWYVAAQANALKGSDLHPGEADITAVFQSNLGTPDCLPSASWYYGLDGNAPSGQSDLLVTVLHELAHGLGMLSLVNETDGKPLANEIDIYSRFLFDRTLGERWTTMTNLERKSSAVNTGNVVWDGLAVTAQVPEVLDAAPILEISAPAPVAGIYDVATALFGPALTTTGVGGNVVRVDDGSGSDACQDIVNAGELEGNVAFVDRGDCAFVDKVTRAQAAGAIAVIIVNNVPGPPTPLGGDGEGITIPSVMIRLDDGTALRDALAGGVVAELRLDPSLHAGADPTDRLKIYAPDPVQPGSSISHWDVSASPDLLMEPFISHDLKPEVDLTLQAFADMGWPLLQSEPAISFFNAVRRGDGALLSWQTTGAGGARILVYRETAQQPRALLGEAPPGARSPSSFLDEDAPTTAAEYWLEVEGSDPESTWYGPALLAASIFTSVFELTSAGPNPFRDESTVRYSLPQPGSVRVTIHDVRGRRVRRLQDVEETPGLHQVTWDGHNDAGEEVAAGVYFARVVFEGSTQVQKLVLLR